MSIFRKIKTAMGTDETPKAPGPQDHLDRELASLNKDGRLHARYVLYSDTLATLRLEAIGLFGAVKDLSYGGIAVRFDVTPDDQRVLEGELGASLTVLDRKIRCKVSPVRVVRQHSSLFAGFTVVHENSDTLIFLREVIEPLRCGKTLIQLGDEVRNERYIGKEWTCLRGDGPTDLLLKRNASGGLAEALLTFRFGDAYAELSYRGGVLRTGRVLGPGAHDPKNVGAQMTSTDPVNLTLLRQAICILTAAPAETREAVRPLLLEASRALGLTVAGAA